MIRATPTPISKRQGKALLSIVIPLKNEEEGLDHLFAQLIPELEKLDLRNEIICVNDGSTDGTVANLIRLQNIYPQIILVDLSRNFGKEAALSAGLFEARGDAIIPLDADLQDPPELIGEMVAKWRTGKDVVLGIRKERKTDGPVKRLTASGFYWLINRMSDIEIPAHAGDFRLMDRAVIDALKAMPERSRFNKGLFAWLGFETDTVYYDRQPRHAGVTKWRYSRLWTFALDGVASFSSLPLRIWSYLGVIIAAGALSYAFYIILKSIFWGKDVAGYASLMTATLFSCGLMLIGLGVIGEYVSRIFIEVKERPLYVIRNVIRHEGNGDQPDVVEIHNRYEEIRSDLVRENRRID